MIQDSGFCKAVILGFNKWHDFKGRASRAEYWYWVLFSAIVQQFANILSAGGGYIFLTLCLSISVRRLHDVNFRGWWLLPFANIVALVLSFFKGDNESNRFENRPDPINTTLFDKVFIVGAIVLLLTLIGLNIILGLVD